jgi:mRNA interferase MazF
MTLQLGEIVLIRMQFHQADGAKVRPAVVLLDAGDDDFVAAPITSRSKISNYDLAIREWAGANLNVPSFARIHKLTVLARVDIVRSVGILSDQDRESLVDVLCRAFCRHDP